MGNWILFSWILFSYLEKIYRSNLNYLQYMNCVFDIYIHIVIYPQN